MLKIVRNLDNPLKSGLLQQPVRGSYISLHFANLNFFWFWAGRLNDNWRPEDKNEAQNLDKSILLSLDVSVLNDRPPFLDLFILKFRQIGRALLIRRIDILPNFSQSFLHAWVS
jgi:hypothetical protein